MGRKLLMPVIITIILAIAGVLIFMSSSDQKVENDIPHDGQIRYLPIGDSYTIGNGNLEEDRWPNVLVKNLNEAGIRIRLIANPAVSGYTVQDAIRTQLPVVERLKPDFVTVFIGANDNFRGISPQIYQQELKNLLDQIQSNLKKPDNIVLITIPDYSKSPSAQNYKTAGMSEGIQAYNQIIKKEAEQRGLKVADIFPISQTMTTDADFISDGLHPSAQGTAKWEQVIYPVVLEKLQEKHD